MWAVCVGDYAARDVGKTFDRKMTPRGGLRKPHQQSIFCSTSIYNPNFATSAVSIPENFKMATTVDKACISSKQLQLQALIYS
jgi:hypothetical protein